MALDCSLTLDRVREIIVERDWMDADSYFLNKRLIFVDKTSEARKKLQDILVDNTLSIGHSNNKGNFLSKFLKGFTISNDGSIVSTTHTLCSFDEGYIPSENDPQTSHEYETSLAFSSETVKRQSSGIDTYSLSLSSPWVDAEAEYRNERSKTNGNEKLRTYLTTRSVYNKKSVEIEPSKLRISDEFKNELKVAIEQNTDPINQFMQLVRVLNNYGWYIVTLYTLGGGFYVTEEKEASSYDEAIKQKYAAEASAGAKFGGYGASAAYEHGSTDGTSNTSKGKSEQLTFNQIGGGKSAHLSPSAFETTLENQANWRIIRHDYFCPSLLLLLDYDHILLSKCMKVLIQHHDKPIAKSLLPKLDIQKYINAASLMPERYRT